jgi:hypothetical protein
MPSLPHVCQLAASGLRTADTGFSGWPTATTRDGKGGYQGGRLRKGKISTDTLDVTAQLASWPTPVVMDANSSARHGYMIKGHAGTTMLDAARLAGWPTPLEDDANNGTRASGQYQSLTRTAQQAAWPTTRASDGEKNVRTLEGSMREIERKGSPQDLAQAGAIAIGSPAGTTNTGQLNPAHSRWLMGYPVAWDDCAPMVTPSSRKSPPRS